MRQYQRPPLAQLCADCWSLSATQHLWVPKMQQQKKKNRRSVLQRMQMPWTELSHEAFVAFSDVPPTSQLLPPSLGPLHLSREQAEAEEQLQREQAQC